MESVVSVLLAGLNVEPVKVIPVTVKTNVPVLFVRAEVRPAVPIAGPALSPAK